MIIECDYAPGCVILGRFQPMEIKFEHYFLDFYEFCVKQQNLVHKWPFIGRPEVIRVAPQMGPRPR